MTGLSMTMTEHLLSTSDLSTDQVSHIFEKARFYQNHFESGGEQLAVLKGKLMATLFFEPSTRTRLSFESAMKRLGGEILSMQGQNSSSQKGESLEDMGRIFSTYADLIVMRHPEAHSVSRFSSTANVPVINAGDGPNQHPTQALLDLYTISQLTGRLDGLNIGFVGDLKYGRTVHSLLSLLKPYNNTIHLISHPELALPDSHKTDILNGSSTIKDTPSLSESIPGLDILYVTRVQTERFESPELIENLKTNYRITTSTLENAKSDLKILHPLPKITEIEPEVDKDPRAKYFEQAQNGVYVRMAILSMLLKT